MQYLFRLAVAEGWALIKMHVFYCRGSAITAHTLFVNQKQLASKEFPLFGFHHFTHHAILIVF